MATVYLATDVRLNRPVAVKVLHAYLVTDFSRQRFRREIQVLLRLSHPHILPLFDYGESGGTMFYVTPFVQGNSLRERMTRENRLPVNDAVLLAWEVASALEYAHREGIVHRDIKPENILLENDAARIADFGVARLLQPETRELLTETGVSVGTPAYMSPEQIDGSRDIDGRSDQYSLACVLYEMLTGAPPFSGKSAHDIMSKHVLAPPARASSVIPEVTGELDAVLLRALAKDPNDRFPDARSFAEALRPYCATGTLPVIRFQRPRSKLRRALIAAAILVAAVASVAVGRRFVGGADAGRIARGGPASIAVMYFDDLSPNRSLAGLADGITESLIRALGASSALRVVSANASAALRGSTASDDSVAGLLGAEYLIRGSVADAGSHYQVRFRLTDPGNKRRLPANTFAISKTDLGDLRDTLTHEVERTLRRRLGTLIDLEASRRESNNDQAWLLYHRAERVRSDVEGESWLGKWDSLSVRRLEIADSLYEAAQSADPKWAAVRVRRADVALLRARRSGPLSDFDHWFDVGTRHAKAALAADSNDVGALTAHGALDLHGWIRHREIDLGRDSTFIHSARRHLERATAVDPNHAEAWYWRSEVARYSQDFVSATFHAERAYAADAFLRAAPRLISQIAIQYYNTQSWSESWRWCREGMRRYPDDPTINEYQLMLLAATTQPRESADSAWRVYRRLERITPSARWPYASRNAQIWVAGALAQAGMKDSARRVLVRARANTEIDPSRSLLGQEAIIRETTLGDRDEALRLIAEYLVSNPGHRAGLARSPNWWFKEMRLDPRWRALVGLP